nr:50S ribosomal protein L18 [Anaerobium acetethylicum]
MTKMVSKKSRTKVRVNKHRKLRNRFSGTAQRPRLAVFRSNNHMYAQIIDDTVGNTLVSASTLQKEVKAEIEKTNNVDAAAYLGTVIAKKALEKGITTVVFDRGGFIYQGKVKAVADAAREAGLEF